MKHTTVSIKEITDEKKNPTFCMSALRYTHNCHKCPIFKNALDKHKDVKVTIEKIRCKPFIDKDIIPLLIERRKLVDRINKINNEVKKIDKIIFE